MTEITTMYLVRYALSRGVQEIQCIPYDRSNAREVGGRLWEIDVDVFEVREEAVAVAERMRQDEVRKLRGRLSKLETMRF